MNFRSGKAAPDAFWPHALEFSIVSWARVWRWCAGEMRHSCALAVACLLAGSPAAAEPLTLQHAIALALSGNTDVAAAHAAEMEARELQNVAHHSWLPGLTVQEGLQRGNQPVFAFGSLMAQRRFTEANFASASLNNPAPISNYRAAIAAHQSLLDGADARAGAADAAMLIAEASTRQAGIDTAARVAQAFGDVLVADADARASDAALRSADEDVARAEARRDAGFGTAADVLSLQVHRAEVQARQIAARGNGRIARATLNRLMGTPLDADWDFVAPAATATAEAASGDTPARRPDVQQAALRVDVASALAEAARTSRLPHIGLDGGYEWNGRSWTDRAGSWVAGVRAEWSWSVGGTEAARARAAAYAVDRARLDRASVDTAARLDLLAARARVDTARARQEVAVGAVRQAQESERIVRNRYEAGLAGVTEVLRASDATLEAESLQAGTAVEMMVASVMLDRAYGRLPQLEPDRSVP